MPSPEIGIQMAYEELVNICDCGEQKEIRTHPRGTWQKASAIKTNSILTYPFKWQEALKALLKKRVKEEIHDIALSLDTALRLADMQWNELEYFLNTLLKDGLIERFDPYPKGSQKTSKIVFKTEVIQSLKNPLGLDLTEKEKERIGMFFETWEYPFRTSDTAKKIAAIIDEMKEAWQEKEIPAVIVEGSRIVMKSLTNYSLLLETLREILITADSHEYISLRELAVKITGDSKGLETIRPYLKNTLGDLRDYGINEHSPLIFCKLPVIGKIGDKTVDLSACNDYVSMTVRTAESFKPVSSEMKRIVLIENLTPFEKIAKESEKSNSDTGIIFLSGYPPIYIKNFTTRLMEFNPVEGLIWCDLDPDGIEIALTAGEWFSNSSWKPIFMEENYLSSSKTKPLTSSDYRKLSLLKERKDIDVFSQLLSEMERLGIKVEQEAQNISFSELKERLSWR